MNRLERDARVTEGLQREPIEGPDGSVTVDYEHWRQAHTRNRNQPIAMRSRKHGTPPRSSHENPVPPPGCGLAIVLA